MKIDNLCPTDKLVFDVNMRQIDRNTEVEENLKHEIAKKYGVDVKNVSLNFNPITVGNDGKEISLAADIISNIQQPEFQVVLFEQWLKEKGITDVDMEKIRAIDNTINSYVDFDAYSKYKNYKFKYVRWKNYLSYGPDNYFDFTTLKGVVKLASIPGNQGGKTTFAIDLIRFALFGRAQKSPNLNSVFNARLPEETECMVEAGIEIDGSDYVIRRTITRPSFKKRTARSKVTQNVEYFRVINGELNEIAHEEGESNTKTNNIIQETVGSVEDFNLVISANHKTLTNLLEMGQTDKDKVFSRWLGLLSLEQKEEATKDHYKKNVEPKLLSKRYNRATLETEITDYNTGIENNTKQITDIRQKKDDVVKEIEDLQKEVLEIAKKRKEIREELAKTDVATIEATIADKTNDLTIKRQKMSNLKDEWIKVKDATFSEEDYKKAKADIEALVSSVHDEEKKNEGLKVEIRHIQAEIKHKNELIATGVCPNCGQPIDTKLQNDKIGKDELEINRLITNGTMNKKRIDAWNEEIAKLRQKVTEMENAREMVHTEASLRLKMTALKEQIEGVKRDITEAEQKKKDIEDNKENIRYNNDIDTRIATKQAVIYEKQRMRDNYMQSENEYTLRNEMNRKEIATREDMVKKLKEEEVTIHHWEVYKEMVGKNGIIKIVLKEALPIINNEIHRILDGLCNFDVELAIDEKGNVRINMVQDGINFDLSYSGSGLEETLASLALRSALASISSVAHPNALVLDEVDSTVNSENYGSLHKLYRRILEHYDFIIHIAHNPLLDDLHDYFINVVKVDGISRIDIV